jgi:Ca2+-binding RTX toxin-like protein
VLTNPYFQAYGRATLLPSLVGGGRADKLSGGDGADILTGGAGTDLLVGSGTAFDLDPIGLAQIRAIWNPGEPYLTRVADLTSGVAAVAFTINTVPDDLSKDTITGKSGSDRFLVGVNDAVKDLSSSSNEFKTSL